MYIVDHKTQRLAHVIQAKKDVNQLLGRNRKKKNRTTSAVQRSLHQPSPERSEDFPPPVSPFFDRKPLPGIGRQPHQGGGVVDSQLSSPTQATTRDKSPPRLQAYSLVGHRLSQHLSVSAGSERAHQSDSHQESTAAESMKQSEKNGSVQSCGEDARVSRVATDVSTASSDHALAVQASVT